ncbi:MAG: hypothetical protein A3B66_02300 [Alphaproteobacteria bacterium RIFCSPHIGHO2_02_FULL_46_13]|nr:MAG: hypothetical protein A3B66_02300 [Alphaproteobacteria bacterium RIFCSPHIGHO2_02_FULL_46_13]
MSEELDIYKTAQIYVDQYGDDALFRAMGRAETYRETGNQQEMILWNKIANTIQWIQMPAGSVDTACH